MVEDTVPKPEVPVENGVVDKPSADPPAIEEPLAQEPPAPEPTIVQGTTELTARKSNTQVEETKIEASPKAEPTTNELASESTSAESTSAESTATEQTSNELVTAKSSTPQTTATESTSKDSIAEASKTKEPFTLPLLRGKITLEDALVQEEDMLIRLSLVDKRFDFFLWIVQHKKEIQELVSFQLGLSSPEQCRVGDVREWLHGSFNVCVPIYVKKGVTPTEKRLLIRFPLPYKIGEANYPGNADEKLRCEVATYVWMQENCPDVPIPKLWGFGFVDGQTGYILVDFIADPGVQMLSVTWEKQRQDDRKRQTLFRDLSRVMLSLSRIPQPRIGSWTIDSEGLIHLANRPLTLRLHEFENLGIPTGIDRKMTYLTSEAYYRDTLFYHDNRIRYQPNSMNDEEDGRSQMANLAMMRTVLSDYTSRDVRHGPFFFQLTDLHQSNIFVDEDWHIKYMIDLEWACSLPVEHLFPPWWMSGRFVDGLTDEHLEVFTNTYKEFADIFEEEERLLAPFPINGIELYRTSIMRRGLSKGTFWYLSSLDSPKGLYNLFHQHIQPRYAQDHRKGSEYPKIAYKYWAADADEVLSTKMKDKEVYDEKLRELFRKSANEESS
ncbi:uncharacterized protein ARB_05007 [Trichophyton benhamiae CBS 112371]|uniref:Aminoglycoside phosphotransferase domain-containing protein n=1 Tax=Arthroderma benhamiae (strain ATCC MYA-4681 / CBS 112371) TaxID=663331 RepID=D4AL11_ARTBC|nr:uncharacterized protein ARB_05007 [Trichophyton benhamiae CBS 112371]EFE36070.1 hypothetical protein ARB_05007 [Trichophyton benhamiae CBS 112371]